MLVRFPGSQDHIVCASVEQETVTVGPSEVNLYYHFAVGPHSGPHLVTRGLGREVDVVSP